MTIYTKHNKAYRLKKRTIDLRLQGYAEIYEYRERLLDLDNSCVLNVAPLPAPAIPSFILETPTVWSQIINAINVKRYLV